jgi:hypothetical protein
METTYPSIEQQSPHPHLDQCRNTLEKILQYYADIPYYYGEVSTYVVVSQGRNHYMLIQEGWEKITEFMAPSFMPKSVITKSGFITMASKTASPKNLLSPEYQKITSFWPSIHPTCSYRLRDRLNSSNSSLAAYPPPKQPATSSKKLTSHA